MKVKDIIQALAMMKDINHVEFSGYGFAPIGYGLDSLLKCVKEDKEPILNDDSCHHIEIRNNVATIYGCFEKYIKKVER